MSKSRNLEIAQHFVDFAGNLAAGSSFDPGYKPYYDTEAMGQQRAIYKVQHNAYKKQLLAKVRSQAGIVATEQASSGQHASYAAGDSIAYNSLMTAASTELGLTMEELHADAQFDGHMRKMAQDLFNYEQSQRDAHDRAVLNLFINIASLATNLAGGGD